MSDDDQGDLFGRRPLLPARPRFNGSDYVRALDDVRLTGQLYRIFDAMRDGRWWTLKEIEAVTGDPQSSISAQLRHLRKKRFGSHTVKKERVDKTKGAPWVYRLIVNRQVNVIEKEKEGQK